MEVFGRSGERRGDICANELRTHMAKKRYQLIDKNGRKIRSFDTAQEAGEFAKDAWPDQEQDEDRSGRGWDVEISS